MGVPNLVKEKPSKDLGKLSREKEKRWPMSQGGKHLVAFERINKASVATEEGLKEEVKPEFTKYVGVSDVYLETVRLKSDLIALVTVWE